MWVFQMLSVLGHALLFALGGLVLGEVARFGMELGTPEPGAGTPSTLFAAVEAEPLEPERLPEPEPEPEPDLEVMPVEPKVVEEVPPAQPPEPQPPQPVRPRPAPRASPVAAEGGSGPGSPGAVGARTASRAEYLRNPPPPYPAEARRRGEQGTVLLLVEVTAAGQAGAVTVKKGSGFSLLDHAARTAVAGWRFQPASIGGLRTDSQVLVPIRFELDRAH